MERFSELYPCHDVAIFLGFLEAVQPVFGRSFELMAGVDDFLWV